MSPLLSVVMMVVIGVMAELRIIIIYQLSSLLLQKATCEVDKAMPRV